MAEYFYGCANLLGRLDYKYFTNDVLGLAKIPEFREIHDPRVQQLLDWRNNDIQEWKAQRETAQTFMKIMDFRSRGACKSSLFGTPLAPFLQLSDPDIAVGLMSASYEDMAVKFTTATKNLWDGESKYSSLTDLYGQFSGRPSGRPWNTDEMVTSKRESTERADPTLKAYSVRKGATSAHFDAFVLDDLITDEEMEGDVNWIKKVISAYLRMPFVLNADGLLYVIGTRYHHGDLCGFIINNEIKPAAIKADLPGAPPGVLPSDFNVGNGWTRYGHLAGWKIYYDEVYTDFGLPTQRPTYPVIWPEARIAAVRGRGPESERFFWFQLMNRPQNRTDAPVKNQHVERVWFDDDNYVPAEATAYCDIHMDFAFKRIENIKKGKGDNSCAYVKFQHLGHLYFPLGFTGHMTQDEFGARLISMCIQAQQRFNNPRIRILTYDKITGQGSGDDSTKKWLESLFAGVQGLNIPDCYPIPRKNTKNAKEQKLLSTAWAWQDGYIHMKRGVEGLAQACEKMLFLDTTDIGDDEADAVSDGFDEYVYTTAPNKERKQRRAVNSAFAPMVPGTLNQDGSFSPSGPVGRILSRRKESSRKWR